jgi:predicted porin
MKLQNRLLAATALAVAGGAQAATVVEMYGTIMPFVESVDTTHATSAAPAERPSQLSAAAYTGVNDVRRTRITAGTSQWGFRGYEDLTPSLKAVWQLESAFQPEQNTGPGLGARNSKLGLAGPAWGEIFMGQWDTPYKAISLAINPLRAGYVFDYTPVMGNPGFGVPATTTQFTRLGAKPDAAFDKRVGNSVQYWSPKWGGFSARLGYSVDEGTTNLGTGPVIRPDILSASVTYDVGGLSLRYGLEQHNDYFGMTQLGGSAAGTATNPSSRDRAHKVIAIWRIGNTRVAGAVERLDYRNDDSFVGAVSEYKRTAYYLLVEQRFGDSSVWGSYSRAQDGSCARVGGASCVTQGLGANYWALGYIYRFSKRTEGFITAYNLDNKASGQYSTQPVVGSAASIAPGAETRGFGVGLLHLF